jgi:hypothetical protein
MARKPYQCSLRGTLFHPTHLKVNGSLNDSDGRLSAFTKKALETLKKKSMMLRIWYLWYDIREEVFNRWLQEAAEQTAKERLIGILKFF